MQGADNFNFFFAAQHTAFQLEVFEPVTCPRRLGQAHDGFRSHGWLVTQPLPVVGFLALARVREVALAAVTDEKQIAQSPGPLAVLAPPQGSRDRPAGGLPPPG